MGGKNATFKRLVSTWPFLLAGVFITSVPQIASGIPAISGLSRPEYWALFAVLGMLTGVLGPILRAFRDFENYRADIEDYRQDVEELLFQSFEKSYLGLAPQAEVNGALLKDMLRANKIQNTFVALRNTNQENNDSIVRFYEKWFRQSKSASDLWEDVVSIRELHSDRYSNISYHDYKIGKHKTYVLKDGATPLNFIIFQYEETNQPQVGKNRPSPKNIVYFGWLPTIESEKTHLFKSTNADIIKLFSDYFQVLIGQSWNRQLETSHDAYNGFELDHSTKGSEKLNAVLPSLVDKKGKWVSVAFDTECDGDFGSIHSVAFLKTNFVGSVAEIENLTIYNAQGKRLPDFKVLDSSFYKNNIYYRYHVTSNNAFGLCHYQFFRHDMLGDIFTGVFCDSSSTRRHALIGFRMDFDEESVRKLDADGVSSVVEAAKTRFSSCNSDDIKNLIYSVL